jgi:hypothetical protein
VPVAVALVHLFAMCKQRNCLGPRRRTAVSSVMALLAALMLTRHVHIACPTQPSPRCACAAARASTWNHAKRSAVPSTLVRRRIYRLWVSTSTERRASSHPLM